MTPTPKTPDMSKGNSLTFRKKYSKSTKTSRPSSKKKDAGPGKNSKKKKSKSGGIGDLCVNIY
jgi:hypothetical protein